MLPLLCSSSRIREHLSPGHSLRTPIIEYYQGTIPVLSLTPRRLRPAHRYSKRHKGSLLGADLYEKFAAECRSLVASGKGDQIKLLPFREAKVIITSAKTFLSYRDVETSKAAVEQMIAHIKVPLLIVYDRADNIQGKGTITRRETIAARIKESAVNCPRADIVVIPSHPGNSPFQAHLFLNNERTVTRDGEVADKCRSRTGPGTISRHRKAATQKLCRAKRGVVIRRTI